MQNGSGRHKDRSPFEHKQEFGHAILDILSLEKKNMGVRTFLPLARRDRPDFSLRRESGQDKGNGYGLTENRTSFLFLAGRDSGIDPIWKSI